MIDAPDNELIGTSRPTLAQRILSHLSRVQSGGRYIPVIDGLRFAAIIPVVLFHWACYVRDKALLAGTPVEIGPLLDNGRLGVQLFFAISGFILALPFAQSFLEKRPRPKLSDYFLRRVTRLEPPYLINLLLLFTLLCLKNGGFADKIWHLLASCTYTHNLVYGEFSTINFVAWTLEIEVQFYLLAPLLAYVFALEKTWLRRTVILTAMLGLPLFVWLAGLKAELNLGGHIQYFLAGFLLADFYLESWRDDAPGMTWCDVALPLIAVGVLSFDLWHDPLPLLALPFLVFAFCFCGFRGIWVRRFFSNPWIATIGGMCYTIYLYHVLLIWIIGPIGLRIKIGGAGFYGNIALQSLFLVPMVLAISAVLFAFFERPFMQRNWHHRMWGWHKPPPL